MAEKNLQSIVERSLSKMKQTKTSPFYRWLAKQKDRDDPIGDLSNDIRIDKGFPIESGSLEKHKSYLISQFACNESIQALEEAHEEFKNKKMFAQVFHYHYDLMYFVEMVTAVKYAVQPLLMAFAWKLIIKTQWQMAGNRSGG